MALDLSAYIKAGYMAQAGCNLQAALDYVSHEEGYPAFIRDSRIWFTMDGMDVPTPYYWEEDMLFREVKQ